MKGYKGTAIDFFLHIFGWQRTWDNCIFFGWHCTGPKLRIFGICIIHGKTMGPIRSKILNVFKIQGYRILEKMDYVGCF